ncbi:hypothetical protein EDD11_002947 [Mortierella claussenii]|nr:hypothetical protein EDD11_002947 [Mortierella claussenii]
MHHHHCDDYSHNTLEIRQDVVSGNALTPAVAAFRSSTPASAESDKSSTTVVIQKPLLEIISPNLTFFAALDLPSPSPPSSSATTLPKGEAASAGNNSYTTGSAPLLLPTSSLAITPSQIYHVDDSQMFGAGGDQALTGVLIEWKIGCDLGDKFPIYPPTERPWIALMSSALLTNIIPQNRTASSDDEDNDNDTSGEDSGCDVLTLISIVQAISNDVMGVIMYHDLKGPVSYEDLKAQTKNAIQRVFYTQSPAQPTTSINTSGDEGVAPLRENGLLTKRALTGLSRDELVAKVASMKQRQMKMSLEHQVSIKPSISTDNSQDATDSSDTSDDPTSTSAHEEVEQPPSSQATLPVLGIMALNNPDLVQVLQTSAKNEGESVIAQMKFVNNAMGPNLPMTPTRPTSHHPPTVAAERPKADRSLGMFFWIILGSVVLIVGVWVGFGVVEARALARRRQQIALDNVKLRTIDQKELDSYKIRIFKDEDIAYSDDEDEEAARQKTNHMGSPGADQDEYNEKDERDSLSDDEGNVHARQQQQRQQQQQQSSPPRVFTRVGLTASRLSALNRSDRNSNNFQPSSASANSYLAGRRSGSFDETLYGGLDAPLSRRASSGLDSLPTANAMALGRDERCRSWAELKGKEYEDYGGESETGYGFDKEPEYKSHAQEGWKNLEVEKLQPPSGGAAAVIEQGKRLGILSSYDVAAMASAEIRRGSMASLHTRSSTTGSTSRRGSADLLSSTLPSQPILKHKSRFILPRKIETALPALCIVPTAGSVVSPTVYGDNISSAGPSTAGFLPPAGWGGERRRSSLSTVAVPDNGRGDAVTVAFPMAQIKWSGPHGQTLRRSSLQVKRINSPGILSPVSKAEDYSGYDSAGDSETDDGRGVGQVDGVQVKGKQQSFIQKTMKRKEKRKLDVSSSSLSSSSSSSSMRSPISDHKARFSLIGVELPDIYAPTTGELSRLSLDTDRMMLQQDSAGDYLYTSRYCSQKKHRSEDDGIEDRRGHHVEELCDSDSGSNGSSSQRTSVSSDGAGIHGNTAGTAKTNTIPTSATTTVALNSTPAKRPRKRRYDPCAICLDEYEVGDQLRELPCKHFFHRHCIDPWFKDVHSICPVCKRDYSQGIYRKD